MTGGFDVLYVSADDVRRYAVQPDALPASAGGNRRLRVRESNGKVPTVTGRRSETPAIRVRLTAIRELTLFDLPWVRVSDVAEFIGRSAGVVRQLAHRYGIPLALLPNRDSARDPQSGAIVRGRHAVFSKDAFAHFTDCYWREYARWSPSPELTHMRESQARIEVARFVDRAHTRTGEAAAAEGG